MEDDRTGVANTLPATEPQRGGGGAPVGERYRLGDVIGRGGMGEVVSARDEQIGRTVAIKRMRSEATPDAIARFLREAQIQGRLEHPAIVPVHELAHDTAGRPFFAMKQLAGVTLNDVIGMSLVGDRETLEKFPRQRLLRAFAEVCLAIEFAHSKGVVHRDLKPANIMLGDYGEVYVLDWGVARVSGEADIAALGGGIAAPSAGSTAGRASGLFSGLGPEGSTVVGTMMGTPGYMAPEQIRGDADLDARADVYALGCILFEILACEPLHPRGKPGLDAALAGGDARPSVRSPERDVPPELDAVCVGATARDRGDRPATARELGSAVQRYLDGDRDVALRQSLAKRELATARGALESGVLESLSHSRRRPRVQRQQAADMKQMLAYTTAIRAAARALALDPKSQEAAELVARLMIEPPAEVPPEVERELVAVEDAALQNHARLGVWAFVGYLVFWPIMYLGGVHETWLIAGGTVLTLAIMAVIGAVARKPALSLVWLSFAGNVLLIALYARGLTPLLVAPGAALVTLMVYASHPRLGHGAVLALACAGGVLVPLAGEALGWWPRTTTIEGARIVMQLPADHLDPSVALAGLGGYVAVIIAMATLITRLQALGQHRMQRSLQIQAWQLRQLVPR